MSDSGSAPFDQGGPTSEPKAPSRRPLLIGGLAVLVVVAGAAFVWFQPHKAFIDERVDERIDGLEDLADASTAAAPDTTAPDTTTPAGPVVTARGDFESLDHPTTGEALLVRLPTGRYALQFTNFRTDNGPDLGVYVSPRPSPAEGGAEGDDFASGSIALGRLKGNEGDQFYELPEGFDPGGYRSVSVWCDRFAIGFGVAPLAAA